MKTLEDFKQEQMKDKEFKQAYDAIQFIANNRAIEELEKIKAKIQEKFNYDYGYDWHTADSIMSLIQTHITELKEK